MQYNIKTRHIYALIHTGTFMSLRSLGHRASTTTKKEPIKENNEDLSSFKKQTMLNFYGPMEKEIALTTARTKTLGSGPNEPL